MTLKIQFPVQTSKDLQNFRQRAVDAALDSGQSTLLSRISNLPKDYTPQLDGFTPNAAVKLTGELYVAYEAQKENRGVLINDRGAIVSDVFEIPTKKELKDGKALAHPFSGPAVTSNPEFYPLSSEQKVYTVVTEPE